MPPTFVETAALVTAGVGRLDIHVDGQPVCSLDLQTCTDCRRGIIHHVQTEPIHRREGYARLAISTALERHPDYTWSCTAVPETPAARAFWEAMDGFGVDSTPTTCRHMRAADDPQDTRRPAAPRPWSSTRK